MRKLSILKLLLFICFCCIIVFFYSNRSKSDKGSETYENNYFKHEDYRRSTSSTKTQRVVISFVVCDSRFNESLNVIKSALLFTKSPLLFIIFTDQKLKPLFKSTLTEWKNIIGEKLEFELQRINFPEAHKDDWMNLFSKCAAQRLFIPTLIPHIDAMIYVDTDTLFLAPAEELWDSFSKFNHTQISAMALEDDNPNVSWYPRFAKHPFYGKYGLNSGVMLMNLTRMREFGWVDYVTPIMLKWKLYIPWGDQDIINIIFHYHESAVYVLSCRYNYRTDQCMYGDACADATSQGIYVLHGSRRAFHNHKQPAFEAVYQAMDEYEIGTEPNNVLVKIEQYFDAAPESNCGNLKDAFLKVPKQVLSNTYVKPER
ncbi:glucoside xylosyltransferase 1 [Colias croceus]|uniref:glucoside xylosyltransferase 1 n=1 Tax=Colias crocea TaxID=72248 RepID=UPI001E27B34B|nr:glucoside xylosyltransferase 1 [Colias croceus]